LEAEAEASEAEEAAEDAEPRTEEADEITDAADEETAERGAVAEALAADPETVPELTMLVTVAVEEAPDPDTDPVAVEVPLAPPPAATVVKPEVGIAEAGEEPAATAKGEENDEKSKLRTYDAIGGMLGTVISYLPFERSTFEAIGVV